MTPWSGWLERGAVLSLAVTAGFVVSIAFAERESLGRVAVDAYMAGFDRDLKFIRATVRGADVLAWQGVGVVVVVVAAILSSWVALLLVPIVVFAPRVFVSTRAEARVAQIEKQIEPWLNAIANSLKASPSIGEAIASTPTLVAAPIRDEIDVLLRECELGTPLDEALDNLAERGRGRTLAGAILALKVARRSGGNLTEMLETTAAALRELARLEGVVRAKTAEGKAQAFVIGIVPIPMILCIQWSDPRYFEPLAATFLGNVIVAIAGVFWACAALSSAKILSVDV